MMRIKRRNVYGNKMKTTALALIKRAMRFTNKKIYFMHIGKRIREVLVAEGHSAPWLAEQIPCERSNVYDIFKRSTLNVDLLYDISLILKHDFFRELSEEWNRLEVCGKPTYCDRYHSPMHSV